MISAIPFKSTTIGCTRVTCARRNNQTKSAATGDEHNNGQLHPSGGPAQLRQNHSDRALGQDKQSQAHQIPDGRLHGQQGPYRQLHLLRCTGRIHVETGTPFQCRQRRLLAAPGRL